MHEQAKTRAFGARPSSLIPSSIVEGSRFKESHILKILS
jgi:hypothetical protein